jgi:hypothetical protein
VSQQQLGLRRSHHLLRQAEYSTQTLA